MKSGKCLSLRKTPLEAAEILFLFGAKNKKSIKERIIFRYTRKWLYSKNPVVISNEMN